MSNPVTYFFGRLNLIANYEDKNQYLIDALYRKIEINKRNSEWGFYDIKILDNTSTPNETFIYGRLVKYKLSKDEDIVQKSTRTLAKIPIQDRAIAASQFFLHIKSGLIAFHPISGKIGQNQFREVFAELIEAAKDYLLVDAEVQVVHEEIKILEAIHSFDKILKLSIDLHPSNPHNRSIWKRTDMRLKEMGASKFKQQYSSENGLKIDDNKEVYADILMAGDGYGKAELYGIKDGSFLTASTDRIPLKSSAVNQDDPHTVLTSILDKFHEIWNRTKE